MGFKKLLGGSHRRQGSSAVAFNRRRWAYLGSTAVLATLIVAVLVLGSPGPGLDASAAPAACFPKPSACGYPDATNTGVPAGTKLTQVRSATLGSGQTLENKEVTGGLTVTGPNATIRNSIIRPSGSGNGSTAIVLEKGATNLTIQSSEVTGNGSKTNAPESNVWNHYNNSGFKVIDSYLHGTPDNIEGAVAEIRDSFVIVDAEYPGAHSENIYLCGANASVQHSTLYNESDETSLIFGDGICGKGNAVTVEDSMLAGGGYMLQPNAKGVSAPVRIVDNRVGRCLTSSHQDSGGGYVCASGADANGYWPRGGHYGISAELGREAVWQGNVWDDNGQPVCASGSAGCGTTTPPPVEEPPAEEPPAEEPPAKEPPAEEPPAKEPPVEEPPAEEPEAEKPPVEEPPAEEPGTKEPPAEEPEEEPEEEKPSKPGKPGKPSRPETPKETSNPQPESGGSSGSGGSESSSGGNGSGNPAPGGSGQTPPPVHLAIASWRPPPSALVGEEITLDGSNSKTDGATSCTWYFRPLGGSGPGRSADGCQIRVRFIEPGVHFVTLTVTGAEGGTDSSRQAIWVRSADAPRHRAQGNGPVRGSRPAHATHRVLDGHPASD